MNRMKVTRYSVCFVLIFTISLVMMVPSVFAEPCSWGSISGKRCVEPLPPIVMILGVALIVIIAVIVSKRKKVTSTEVPSSAPVPSSAEESTKESQEENNTDIDKQIAINEEKIRKMEEESKRLDEED